MTSDRREFIRKLLIGAGMITLFPGELIAEDGCAVQHPFMPPRPEFKGMCHNCGMMRPMWARTWHTYSAEGKTLEVCSMHCLAEATLNAGTSPENVQVALYLDPATAIPAEEAYYVVGSKARGTMSMNSKLAFDSKEKAESFAGQCGGSVARFADAYQIALTSINKENMMINRNRVEKGKIVEPVEGKDSCPVCGMHAAGFPKNKCQMQSKDGVVLHFCCTQCLFAFINDPGKYSHPGFKGALVWVTDYGSGSWIYAPNGYYVVGTAVKGPMGKEAFPFVNAEKAKEFAAAHSGRMLRFDKVSIETVLM